MSVTKPTVGQSRGTWGAVLNAALDDLDTRKLDAASGTYVPASTPQAHGVVGDGVADDTVAIQAAINAASSAANSAESGGAGRGLVYLPPGLYKVTNLTLKSNVTIRGAGFRATTLIAAGTSGYALDTSGISHGTRMANAHIEGLTIAPVSQQNGLATPRAACGGINLSYSTWCSLRDVFIHNLAGVGINCTETYDLNTHNVHIGWTGVDASTPGLLMTDGTGDSTNANHHFGLRIEQCPVLLNVSGSTYRPYQNQFVGCKFEWHTNGTLTHAGPGIVLDGVRQLTFDSCMFVSDDDTYPLVRTGASENTLGVKFNGCDWLAPTQWTGWALDAGNNTLDLQVVGGHMENYLKGITSLGAEGLQVIGLAAYDTTAPVVDAVAATITGCNFKKIRAAVETPMLRVSARSRVVGNFFGGQLPNTDGISVGNDATVAYNTFDLCVAGIFFAGTGAISRGNRFTTVTQNYNGSAGYAETNYIEDGPMLTRGRALSPYLRSGLYYPTVPTNSTTTSVALGNGTMRVTPFYVPRAVTITRIGAEITLAGDAGSKLRLVIYNDDGTGYPGSLLLDAGTINADSATVQEVTISQALTPGTYWVGAVVQGVTVTQPTVRTVSTMVTPAVGLGTATPGTNQTSVGYSQTGVTGTPPGTFTTSVTASGLGVRMFVKVA